MHGKTRPDPNDPFLLEQEYGPEQGIETCEEEIDLSVFEDAEELAELIRSQPANWEEDPPEYELYIRPWDLLVRDDPYWYAVPDHEGSNGSRPVETDDGTDHLA